MTRLTCQAPERKKWTPSSSSPRLSEASAPHKISLRSQARYRQPADAYSDRKMNRAAHFPCSNLSLFLLAFWCTGTQKKEAKNKGDMWHFSLREGQWMTEIMRHANLDQSLKCAAAVQHGQWDLTAQLGEKGFVPAREEYSGSYFVLFTKPRPVPLQSYGSLQRKTRFS